MKKQNIAIIAVVAFVLAVAVGYALFRETITINGTATAKGSFDVEISAASVSDESKAYTSADAVIASDKNSLTLTAELPYPGAYVIYDVTLANVGTIDAVLESVTETGTDVTAPLRVSYLDANGEKIAEDTLASGATDSFKIKVEWLTGDDEDETDATIDNSVDVTAEYKIVFNYVQVQVQ